MSEYTPETLDELADYSKFDEAPRPSILFAHADAWRADRLKLEAMGLALAHERDCDECWKGTSCGADCHMLDVAAAQQEQEKMSEQTEAKLKQQEAYVAQQEANLRQQEAHVAQQGAIVFQRAATAITAQADMLWNKARAAKQESDAFEDKARISQWEADQAQNKARRAAANMEEQEDE